MGKEASKTKQIAFTDVALPKGGGAIKGIGETFVADMFSGTGSFTVPVYTSPCRGIEPKISLNYNSSLGSSSFGVGFSLSLPSIMRRTDTGIPKYDDTDRFILSNDEELVHKLRKNTTDIETIIVEKGGTKWEVISYCPRVQKDFAEIQFWKGSGDSFWKVTSKDNVINYYGESKNSRITDPENEEHTFQWLLEKTVDKKGNVIKYTYKSENDDNIKKSIYEENHKYSANKYIASICYGNYFDEKSIEKWAFEVVFDYGEYNIEEEYLKNPHCNPYNDTGKWAVSKTPFSSYRSGFEIRTLRLCKNILMFHHLEKELGENPTLVRVTKLKYDESQVALPMLSTVEVMGLLRKDDGSYEFDNMPPLEFSYSSFNPVQGDFKELTLKNGEEIPLYIDEAQYNFIDLYGEGIKGLIYNDENTTLYMSPSGKGKYEYPKTPNSLPLERDFRSGRYVFASLNGDGKLDLVVNNDGRHGFYEVNENMDWSKYQPFKFSPLDLSNPLSEMVDLDGDGCSELVVLDEGGFKYYPSLKKEGFDIGRKASISIGLDPDFPICNNKNLSEFIGFGDMFGDGLSHRIRIKSGMVECWPNLGYGRFGEKIIMGNPPVFEEELDISRLFLADLDGSGAMDIAYVYSDRVDIFINKGGNYFESPISIKLPQKYNELCKIFFADINGNGTTSLIFSVGEREVKNYYYDFNELQKPYLLTKVNNNMGAITCLGYTSSVKFYLEDKNNGASWKTVLPFPVQVLEKVENIDTISGIKMVTKYKYHEGYYNSVDREFKGFGYVESWDTESYEESLSNKAYNVGKEKYYVPPVYTKRWYHTGAYIEAGVLSKQYEREYYNEDFNGYNMPDSIVDCSIDKDDSETLRQAYRALAGRLLREEVYGVDNSELTKHPYFVKEASFEIRQIQKRENNKNAVLYVYERELIQYQYERNPNDPRIKHNFNLQVDDYGNKTQVCELFYPRRQAEYSEQGKLKAIVECTKYINSTENGLLLGIPYEVKNYEIGGLYLTSSKYFTFEELNAQVKVALYNEIENDKNFEVGQIQGKLLCWNRLYFWNDKQTEYLPIGEITPLALLHHIENAEFSSKVTGKVFGDKVTKDILEKDGGYVLREGYWWNRGLVQYYFSKNDNNFFLPWKIENSFVAEDSYLHSKTQLEYDSYLIAIKKEVKFLTDSITNVSEIFMDYRTIQPKKIVDINGNSSEIMFDALGRVKVVSNHGTMDGKIQGDEGLENYINYHEVKEEDIVSNPEKYLQNASAYFFYNVHGWREKKEPVSTISLVRETYVSDLAQRENLVQIQINYSDGFGRNIETKSKADSGSAILWDERGNSWEGYTTNRWLVSGRIKYNNKGKPYKIYEPYFSSISNYEGEKYVEGALPRPKIMYYDPLLRVIKIDTPKGFFSKVEFSPWKEKYYDENDTVKDSKYYNEFIKKYPENPNQGEIDEKDSLDKAMVFYNTPKIKVLNTMGNVFIEINEPSKDTLEITKYELDIYGKIIHSIDPRLYLENKTKGTDYCNFKYVYSMTGNVLEVVSADAGRNKTLFNIFGNEIYGWDNRGFQISTIYDKLQRVIGIKVKGDDEKGNVLNQTVEKIIYGEHSNINTGNLRGKVYKHYDQAGVTTFKLYDIKGMVVQKSRQIKSDYKNEVNWDDINKVGLDKEIYNTSYIYDALGKVISETSSDESIYLHKYDKLGLLCKVQVKYKGGNIDKFVEDIKYNSRGQRTSINYGNGVITKYTYEDATSNLLNIISTRIDNSYLQNISYTYDPVGNITRIRDSSHGTVFNKQQIIEPISDYTYDGLYRLISSKGREHPGIKANSYKYEFKQCGFIPFSMPNINDSKKLENYIENYNYDGSGNLISIKHSSSSMSWTRQTEVACDSNRTQKVSTISGDLDFYNTSYDGNGNIEKLEHIQRLNWNYRNNLSRADVIQRDGDTSDSEYYVYDSKGNRVRKVLERKISNGITEIEEKIYLGNVEIKKIKRRNGGSENIILERTSLHVMDGEKRIAISNIWIKDDSKREVDTVSIRKTRYHLGNNLGSSCMEIDEQGSVISYEEYYPFGGTSIISGKNEREVKIKEYRYSGKERDDVTGLYYYGVRYYAPWIGRWLTPDPATNIDGLNLYAFVRNNPVAFIDYKGYEGKKSNGDSGASKTETLGNNAEKDNSSCKDLESKSSESKDNGIKDDPVSKEENVSKNSEKQEEASKDLEKSKEKLEEASKALAPKESWKDVKSKLKDTENFGAKALDHIFDGEVKKGKIKNQGTGFHYAGNLDSKGKVLSVVEKPNKFSVYVGTVAVDGFEKGGNGGRSTFFPSAWNPQKVVDEINLAYKNKVAVPGSSGLYRGTSSEGVPIEMFINSKINKIVTAYPIYEPDKIA